MWDSSDNRSIVATRALSERHWPALSSFRGMSSVAKESSSASRRLRRTARRRKRLKTKIKSSSVVQYFRELEPDNPLIARVRHAKYWTRICSSAAIPAPTAHKGADLIARSKKRTLRSWTPEGTARPCLSAQIAILTSMHITARGTPLCAWGASSHGGPRSY
jgi:hypothetical protein